MPVTRALVPFHPAPVATPAPSARDAGYSKPAPFSVDGTWQPPWKTARLTDGARTTQRSDRTSVRPHESPPPVAHLDLNVRATSTELEARDASTLPRALAVLDEIRDRLAGRRVVVFLDYDGTLTPIVSNPEDAVLSTSMRAAVDRLSQSKRVAIVSGRGREKVEQFVQLSSLFYAGSHGHDISGPSGLRHQIAEDALPTLSAVRAALVARLADVPGASVEDNKFSVSVHWRNVPHERRAAVENATRDEVSRWEGLRYTTGKCVYEVRPALPSASTWNKGEAVRYLLDYLSSDAVHEQGAAAAADEEIVPIYVGDDTTDEDAFAVLHELGGLSFLVASTGETERPRETFGTHVLADCAEVETLLNALASF